jgi:hypothetical protein
MNSEYRKMLEAHIYELIAKYDFASPDFSMNEFKTDLKNLIGMSPAVKIKWNTQEKINELKRAAGVADYKTIIDKAEEIEIGIVDENNVPVMLKFIV